MRRHPGSSRPVAFALVLTASVAVCMPSVASPTYRLQVADLVAANTAVTQPVPVAVLDFRAIGGPEERVAEAVAENLRNALVQHRQFAVIERSQIQQVLKEQSLTQTGLTDSRQAVTLGRLLGAKVIVVGSVTKLGDTYTVNARFIDGESGQVTEAKSLKTDNENDLAWVVDELALALGGKATPGAANAFVGQRQARTVSTGKSKLLASGMSLVVPGVGQFYNGNIGWGIAQFLLNAVGLSVGYLGYQSQSQPMYYLGELAMGLCSVWSGIDAWSTTVEQVPEH
jgi:TolB-like protein/TM2 domain-containing membrane protein YozV